MPTSKKRTPQAKAVRKWLMRLNRPLGLNGQDLAAKIGTEGSTVSRLLGYSSYSNVPSWRTLHKIADAFDTQIPSFVLRAYGRGETGVAVKPRPARVETVVAEVLPPVPPTPRDHVPPPIPPGSIVYVYVPMPGLIGAAR